MLPGMVRTACETAVARRVQVMPSSLLLLLSSALLLLLPSLILASSSFPPPPPVVVVTCTVTWPSALLRSVEKLASRERKGFFLLYKWETNKDFSK